ncbi:MAG: diadenylate cyclase CdaA, partial [Oscillospiraceae bacterium]|nr:diadenylate cyclase CdaA [Candidatus Equicaccousia limihippi]
IIYKCIVFFRETRATQLVKGLLILLVIWVLAQWLNLVTMKWLLFKVFDSFLVIAVILFQPELRRALEGVGRSRISPFSRQKEDSQVLEKCISSVSHAAGSMQEQKVGALIVFERNTLLGEIIDTGKTVDAQTSSLLINNIFFPNSPLHDGAVIIRSGRIAAAGCILPLVQDDKLNSSLGTRHRAAIGISEISDAVVVVVSEETGTVSVVENGTITRGYNNVTLYAELIKRLMPADSGEKRSKLKDFFKKSSDKEGGSDD